MFVKKTKFRSEATNARYTRQLFVEPMQPRMSITNVAIDQPYSLYNDYPGVINFRKEYVRLGDPTGYKMAELYLEDYSHWQLLMKAKWFIEAKKVWDLELDAKLKAEAMAEIKSLMQDETVNPSVRLSAAKFLSTGAHKEQKVETKRGRPSTEEVEGELKRTAAEERDFAADLARIRSVK